MVKVAYFLKLINVFTQCCLQIKWLHVGVFHGESEDLHNGHVYQADHDGIKISFLPVDLESGIVSTSVRVGTGPGLLKDWLTYSRKTVDLRSALNQI